ncbi:hypothetical protein ES703_70350 [subsurface metagenome]
MKDENKTKDQLIEELEVLHQRVTELEKLEVARREVEKGLRFQSEVVENMAEGVYLIRTCDGMIVYANPTFEHMFGYDSGELVGKHVSIVNAPDEKSPEETAKEIIQGLDENGVWSGEAHNVKKDGTMFWCYANVSTFNHPDYGAVWVAVHEDITERKQAEEALQQSEERYHVLFNSGNDAVFVHHPTPENLPGKFIEVNDVACQLLGYTREELSKLSPSDIVALDKAKLTPSAVMKRLLTEKRILTESVFSSKDGRQIPVEINIHLFDLHGRPTVLTIARDITERKKAEELLRASREQLRSLSAHLQSVREEERTGMARRIHDELGQTLTALKIDLSWLAKRLPKEQESLLDKIKSMSELIDMMIQTVKRISTELRPGVLDDLGLTVAIEWQAEEFQKLTGIKCEFSSSPKDIVLDQDRSTAIFRIFQETLTNIFRHANATKVEVSLEEVAGKVALTVIDNGRGITEKQIYDSKAFGLIGIRERVRFLEGEVKISGTTGRGTIVRVGIPLNK